MVWRQFDSLFALSFWWRRGWALSCVTAKACQTARQNPLTFVPQICPSFYSKDFSKDFAQTRSKLAATANLSKPNLIYARKLPCAAAVLRCHFLQQRCGLDLTSCVFLRFVCGLTRGFFAQFCVIVLAAVWWRLKIAVSQKAFYKRCKTLFVKTKFDLRKEVLQLLFFEVKSFGLKS